MINLADSVYGIYKRAMRVPTKENAVALVPVTVEARTCSIRARNMQE